MRSRRLVLVVAGALLALAVAAPTASAQSTPTQGHLIKDCGTFTGGPGSFCTITVSDIDALPPGSRIVYMGPVLDNQYFLSSKVVADAGPGAEADGYCIFDGKTSAGLCSYWQGSGTLAGFTAIFDVTVDSAGLFHLDGTYYFADVVRPPDTSTDGTLRNREVGIGLRPF